MEQRTIRSTADAIALLDEWRASAEYQRARAERAEGLADMRRIFLQAERTLREDAEERLIRISVEAFK